jgi:serine/threonine protein kinase/tetratricopeptide (TPR) repeat protein
MIPETLSHYRVMEKIGTGGMGVVYRAHDEQLDRDVALKVLPAGTLADDGARRRFRREALALAKLNHPNVGAVYEFGQQDGVDFLVMELVSGISLDSRIAAGALLEKDVLRLGIQLADGLEAAHAQGIVHRDLKPGNLRLTSDGRLKILDFGLAQWSQPEEPTAMTVSLTKSQQISGTLPYMAPEQLRGHVADHRSDIYSAGAVLYEMITAKRPFPEVSGPQLISAILERQPSPVSAHNHRVSPALESILIKALDKEPDRRYQSARELRVDLERLSGGVVPPVQQSTRWKWVTAGAALAVLVILGAANVGGWRDRLLHRAPAFAPAATNSRRSVAVLGFKNLSGKPDEAWISTALSEMLTTELAAGEQLRTVPGENVAQMKTDLSLQEADSFGSDTLEKIRKRLGSDLVILGSYLALGKDAGGKIRLDFRLQDTVAGETIASVTESGTEDGLLELVSHSGATLRQKLGVGDVSESQASDIKASLPANPEAARFYSEGLAKLRVFEAQQARDLLQKAIAADPKHAPSHAALAGAWASLGYDSKAQEQARQAFDLSATLSREQRLAIEGRYYELQRDWPKAIEIYRTLWRFFPDNLDYGLRLATVQTSAGQGQDARATVEELRKVPAPAVHDARIDLAEAKAADSLGDFKRVQAAAAEAVKKGREQGAVLMVAQARLTEGGAMQHQGQQDLAAAAFSEAQQLFANAGERQAAAVALQFRGGLLYDKGDYDAARKIFEEALVVFREIGAEQNVSGALNRIGNVYYDQGRLTEAKSYYEKTLDLDRKIGSKQGVAGSLGNLANVLDGLGDLQGALKMQEECLQAFTEVGNKRGMASTLANLGIVLEEIGDLENAKKRFEQAAHMQREASHRRGEAFAIYGIGDVLMAQGNLVEARKRQEEALSIRQQTGEAGTAAQSLAQLALLSLEEDHAAESEKLARQAADEFGKDKSAPLQASAYSILARALLAQKKLPEAQVVSERAVELSVKNPDRAPRFDATLARARVMAATGKSAEAIKLLNAVLGETRKLGYVSYELESILVMGEIEINSGNVPAGKTRLEALEKQATAKGFRLVAQKAAKLRKTA